LERLVATAFATELSQMCISGVRPELQNSWTTAGRDSATSILVIDDAQPGPRRCQWSCHFAGIVVRIAFVSVKTNTPKTCQNYSFVVMKMNCATRCQGADIRIDCAKISRFL
jgi:hypothetical protein